MSQPEKFAYCAFWAPPTVCTCRSKPVYCPLTSLNTLGCNSAW